MIDNPIIEFLLVLFAGFCLGVVVSTWYVFRLSKNVVLKAVTLIGVKVKRSDVTFEDFWNVVNTIINKSLEEVRCEELKKDFKTEISDSST